MGVVIGPDLGDSTEIQDLGVRWTISYHWRDTVTLEEGNFTAEFPRDFNELNPSQVEAALLQLAMTVAQNTGVHE